jgi:WD40 repeat protein
VRALATLVAVALLAAAVWWLWPGGDGTGAGGPVPSASPHASPSPSAAVLLDRELEGPASGIAGAAFSQDDAYLAVAGQDNKIRFWNIGSGTMTGTIDTANDGKPTHLAYRPSGDALAVILLNSSGYVIQSRNLSSGRPMWTVRTPDTVPLKPTYSPDGQLLAVGDLTGRIQLLNADTGAVVRTLRTAHTLVGNVAFTSGGRVLVASSFAPTRADGVPSAAAVQMWDPATGVPTGRIDGYKGVAVSPDSRTLALTTPTDGLAVYDLGTGAVTVLGGDRTTASFRLAFVSDTRFVTYDPGTGFALWDIPTRRKATRFGDVPADDGSMVMVTTTSGGRLVTGGLGRPAELWKVSGDN